MVFIENRIQYLKTIISNRKLNTFYSLLYGKCCDLENISDNNEIDLIYYGVINSLLKDNKENFDDNYSKLISRTPNKDFSPFIHDDVLIFCLIVGIIKFKKNKEWITRILQERFVSQTTITFKNIVNENFSSTENLSEVIIVFKFLLKDYDLMQYLLDDTYLKIVDNSELFDDKNDFLIITKLKALDCIILLKNSPDTQAFTFLKKFETTFLKRTKFISTLLYLSLLSILIYYLTVYVWSNQWLNELFQNLGLVLTILGIGLFGYIFKWIKKHIEILVNLLFGYKQNNKL